MIGPLARLIDQAEVSLSDLTRRAVASVTAPIKAKGQELATETLDAALGVVKTVAIKAVLGLVAAIMLIVAIVYAISALYQYLLPILGPVEARLVLAGAFLLIAIVAIVLLVFWPKSGGPAKTAEAKARIASAAEKDAAFAMNQARVTAAQAPDASERQAEAAATAAQTAASPADLAAGFETMVSALGDAGFRREQAGLRAGLALARQLKPMQIVSLALIGGFIAATRYPRRR